MPQLALEHGAHLEEINRTARLLGLVELDEDDTHLAELRVQGRKDFYYHKADLMLRFRLLEREQTPE